MSNRKTVSRIAFASLALVIISSVTFASPWSAAMDWLGLGEPAPVVETAATVQPDALVTTVTTNGGSGLAPTYPDLAAAITALNAATITSPVVITVSGTETAPAGGYSITATGTAVNTITLNGGGAGTTVITAAAAPTVGSRTDAIFKIIGGDFITLDGFTLQENAANITGGALAVQQMTEFGVALFAASTTNGAQNNTIKSNTITLSSATAYQNAIGIFSTTASSSTNGAQTAASIAGTNSNNKFYTNTISGVAQGLYFISPAQTATVFESGNDIGGSTAGQGNNITYGISNTAGDLGFTSYSGTTPAGVYFRNVVGNSVRFNTINSVATLTLTSGGIFSANGTAPTGVTYTTTFSDNNITITNASTTAVTGIEFGSGLSTGTIVSSNNTVLINQNSTAAVSAAIGGIRASYASASSTLNTNNITVNQAFTPAATAANSSAVTALALPGGTTGTPTVNSLGNTIVINRSTNAGAGITATMSGTLTGITATIATTTMNVGAAGAGNANAITIKEAVAGAGTSTYSSAITYINANAIHATVNVKNNTLNTTGSTIRSTGTLIGVFQDSTVTTLVDISNNTMNVDRVAASGAVSFQTTLSTPSEVADTLTGNNITFTSLAGTTSVTGISAGGGNGFPKNVSSNTINISGTHTGASVGILSNFTGTGTYNSNSITIGSASASVTGMSVGGSASVNSMSSNTVSLTSSSTAPTAMTGLTITSGTGAHSVTNNTFSAMNFTGVITTSPTVSGLVLTGGTGANVFSNTINNISIGAATSTASPVIDGLLISGGTSINVFKNKIYGITTAATGTSTIVSGIRLSAGATNTVYNNLIGGLTAGASASTDSIRGINITSTTTTSTNNFYYNSVYLNAASTGANFGTTGIFHTISTTSTTAALNLRNNIIANVSTPTGTGLTVAYRRSGGAASNLANYAGTSNNNCFYAGIPSATNLIYSDGTSSAQTFTAYKNGVFTAGTISPRDQASFTEDVTTKFLSTSGASANFLHISSASATQLESGAVNIATFTDDYDAQTRQGNAGYPAQVNGGGTAPDIGADEFDGIPQDLTGPSISYALLGNGANGATRAFTNVTITDSTGVNGTAGTRPRVYYKKASDANNTFNDNTSATTGWKYVEATGGTSPFSFTIDYSLLNGGGVSIADVIQYFVVAQDTAAPTVSINSGTFTAQPTSVALTAAAFPIGGTINTYTIAAAIPGTLTLDGATYTSLTKNDAGGIFKLLNAGVLTGNVTINITADSTTEDGAVALNQLAEDPIGNYTVTIKANGAPHTISGATASNGLIRLNGADRVVIDGSTTSLVEGLSAPSSDALAPEAVTNLTITNTSTTSPTAISLISLGTGAGATNNTIKNCSISTGVSAATGYGVAIGGSTPGTSGADNDNNTVQDNTITVATVGVYAAGTASVTSGGDDNLAITGNSIDYNGALGSIGIQVGNALNSSVSQNTVSEQTSAIQSPTGISLETGFVSSSVTRNTVTKALTTNTGGYGGRGITIGTGTASSALTLANNVVYGVNGSNFSGFSNSSSMGIAIGMVGNSSTITTTAGGINLYFNSVNMTGSMGAGSTTAITTAMYVGTGASALDLRNNVFVNTQTGTATGQKNYAIFSAVANTAFTTINYNDYYVSNSFNAASAIPGNIAATDRTNLAGIQTGFGQNVNSIIADPLFNSPTNLAPQTGSPIVGAGVAGTGVTIDFLGAARGATPTMGAYENATDTAGPVIAYSALTNTVSTGDRTLSITVTDTSGVPSSGIGLPVIYYRKNAGAYVNTQCVFASGSSFNCDLLAASMGGLTTGDTVSYYVAAQDNLGNVSVNPSAGASGLTANPPAAATPPTTPNSYLIATAVTGSYSVNSGGGGDALSLTNTGGIFQTINNGVVTGNVTINIDSDLTGETGTVALNQFASPFTVTIKPNGAPRTITGTGSGGILIKLNGADNVTIDGSTSGGTDRSLTLINPNTATGTGTLFVASLGTGAGATNDTIKNCIIKAGSIGSTTVFNFGIFVGDTTGAAAGADNDNLTIQNNQIMTTRTGIQATGTVAGVLDNLNINNNLIGDNTPANSIGRIGMTMSTVNNASVTSNTVKNISIAADTSSSFGIIMSTSTGSSIASNTVTGISATGSSVQPSGIFVSTATTGLSITGNTVDGVLASNSVGPQGITVGTAVTNSSVTRNNVLNINYTGTGGYGGKGIEIGTASASSNLTVANNFVSNIKGDCWSAGANILDTVMGIRVVGATGGVNIYNNSVNLASGSFAGNTQPATISAALYIASTATTLNVRNNILTNNLDNTAETGDKNYAFYSDAANTAFTDINFNDYWVPASTAGGPQVLGFLGSDRVLLTDIQTATGKDAASISGDPLFASATDLHIASGSPARNTGATIATVTDDYDGNARPQEAVYEIGADEYVDGIAPDTTIDSSPSNPSNSASATFTFSGTDSLAPEAVASFECDLDGGGFATCTSPKNYPALSDGSHTFQVRAKDAGGNVDPTPASFTWVIDAMAPNTNITANPTNPSNSTSASFSFTGNDGSGTGIASFQCQIDGGGFSTCTSPANYPGLSEGSHTFQVRAIDNVGNVDPTPASYTWVIDTIAPDTNITANPTNPTNSASASFSFTGSDPGGSGVASFQCQIDGGGYSTCTSPANYPSLSDGSHTFQVRAVDGAGNTDASPASYTWLVDTTPPSTTILTMPANPTNSTTATFTFSGNDGSGSGVASFSCQIDAGGFAPCTSGVSYPGLGAGTHVFDVRAIDNAGNSNPAVQTYIWTIDLTAPVIGAYTPLSNTLSTGSRPLTVTVTDNLAVGAVVLHYSINGGSYLTSACVPAGPPNTWTCTLPGNSTGTAVAYYVSATDTATNSAEAPSSAAPHLYTVGAAAVPAGTYTSLSMYYGSSIGGNVTVINSLELNGVVTTGVNTITLNCGAVVTGAGSSSYVSGNLLVNFCATGAFTFPVGSTPDGLRPDSAEPEGFAGEYSPMTATITAGTFPSSLKVSVDDNFMLGMVQTSAISRNWSVEETGNITADMTFTYLDQDINGPESGYKVFKRSGGFTTEVTPNSNNPAANTVTVLNVSNFSQWTAGAAFTTAAGASISGRVTTASGNGIRNAYVTISGNSLPAPIRIQTGSLGWYHFENLAAGETYIIQVGAKRFRFAVPSRVIALQDNLSDVDFVANPPE